MQVTSLLLYCTKKWFSSCVDSSGICLQISLRALYDLIEEGLVGFDAFVEVCGPQQLFLQLLPLWLDGLEGQITQVVVDEVKHLFAHEALLQGPLRPIQPLPSQQLLVLPSHGQLPLQELELEQVAEDELVLHQGLPCHKQRKWPRHLVVHPEEVSPVLLVDGAGLQAQPLQGTQIPPSFLRALEEIGEGVRRIRGADVTESVFVVRVRGR
mmetsp:Transcript_4736/g.14130  ORF Transcript_4736/g.14130 Transcript_4736/m.14130 type:complete len:211 (+) Transcript_4736:675-1307(+)